MCTNAGEEFEFLQIHCAGSTQEGLRLDSSDSQRLNS